MIFWFASLVRACTRSGCEVEMRLKYPIWKCPSFSYAESSTQICKIKIVGMDASIVEILVEPVAVFQLIEEAQTKF